MDIFEQEFYTNKSISKPSRKLFGMEDDEIGFIVIYFLFFILSVMFFLGILPNIFKIKISIDFINNILIVFGFYIPVLSFLLLKIFKYGKQTGYINQKLYMFFNTMGETSLDFRNRDTRDKIKKYIEKPLDFINNPENPINKNKNKDYFKFSSESSNKKIEEDYKKSIEKYKIYLKRKRRL